ncbi:transposase [Micromonospora sp. NPDC049891]|uniref:transposase n=1 Tax=Micromonospora sp. NPDC049891 TaxID=3155655 RepID=UPI0033F0AF1F
MAGRCSLGECADPASAPDPPVPRLVWLSPGASDLTDAAWEIVEPTLPSPQWMGKPEKDSRRAVVDGILYVVRTGHAWRYLPVDFPPWQTAYSHLQRLNRKGVTERILTELRERVRLAHDRQAEL